MTRGDFEVLESRIREELGNIEHLNDELVRGGVLPKLAGQAIPALPGADSFALRAIGSVMHDFYNSAENLFKMIARDMDGSLPSHPDWHRSLLTQMSLPLTTRRPPVLRKETVAILDEFRAFRHVFRNVYGFALDPERLHTLLSKFPQAVDMLSRDLDEFIQAIRRIAPGE